MAALRWLVSLLFCIVIFLCVKRGEAKRIPRWWLKVAQKQGPNACVVEEVPGMNKEFWTECKYWLNRNICGRKTRIRFECCEGFDQMDGEDGCRMVKPLKNVLETAEELGATEWARYIRESGLQNDLESPGAFTLFVPTNDAFNEMKPSVRSQVDGYRGNPTNPVLLYHILPSKLRSEDFEADLSLPTLHQGHNIRINKYSNGMTTVNCALVVRKNQEATNGIVHVIDTILDPSLGINTNVADLILKDGRFQIMAEMLEKSGYINVLRSHQDSISILAPYDEAFQQIPESRREKIINDREARLALLQNHVVPHVICESAITGEHKVRTMGGNKLTFNCDIDGTYVEDAKLKGQFNIGKNGIMHMLDDVLLPDRAKNLIELAESRNLNTFVDLVKRSGLEETLSHTGDYTFFVPEETAWLEVPPETIARANNDPEYAGLMLRFHGAYGRHLTSEITDNQAIMSLDEEHPVRLQVWRRAMGVEDAKITASDLEAQNGVIHVVSKVIFPSNQTIAEVLESIPGKSFNTFLSALGRVTAADPSLVLLGPGTESFYTFFVPTDEAFSRTDQDLLNSAITNLDTLTVLIKKHVAVNMFPETSFEPGLVYTINGLEDDLTVHKTASGKLEVNGNPIIGSYMTANGVVYIIDKVFMPEDNIRTSVRRTSISTVTHQGGSRTYSSSSRSEKKFTKTILNGDFGSNVDLESYPQGIVTPNPNTAEHAQPPVEKALPPSKKRCSPCTRRTSKRRRRKYRKRNRKPKVPKPILHDVERSYLELTKKESKAYPTALEIDDYQPSTTIPPSTYSNQSYILSNSTLSYAAPVNTFSGRNHSTTSFNTSYAGYSPPQTIEKIFTYKYTFDNYPLHGAVNNYTSHKTDNSISHTSEPSKKFSYVGHHYGNDVVGRDYSKALPFSAPEPSYVQKHGAQNAMQYENNEDRRRVSTRTHKTVSSTSYTVPITKVSRTTSSFTFPMDRKPIPSVDSQGKKVSDLFSAYAFTNGDSDFADGTDFSNVQILPEDVITEQAKIFRKQWRRKRHNKRRRNRKRLHKKRTRKHKRM